MQYYMQHLFCQRLSGYEATNAIAPFLRNYQAIQKTPADIPSNNNYIQFEHNFTLLQRPRSGCI